ncbi:MAG TPA: 2-amino-4-hydroxy-6-hydroxymethyldihydropteridine diphosphokinase [Bacteroidetes bacterium]|nr:2-amino-4-hydroxy-6-hydroxymethyldihydropteridine diphosphokinase [Bacteroidota bacterium]
MLRVFLGLGSNVGDKIKFIKSAIEEISKLDKTNLTKESSYYETEPWGLREQDDFINSVIEITTELEAKDLFMELKNIEKKLHRKNRGKWEQREIDIDILFYGNEVLKNETINIPHKEIENRKFVLIPMSEIDENFIHPEKNKSIKELLKETKDTLEVKKITIE